jgi:hypothetical protein
MDISEAERYLEVASKSMESDRGCVQYGIALACGRLNRFDFEKAIDQFSRIAESNRLARCFVDLLGKSDDLVSAVSISESGTVFSLFRDRPKGSPRIRLMNAELCEHEIPSWERFQIWIDLCRSAFPFLIDLSHREGTVLESLPSDLLSCTSIRAMIPLLFKMYSKESVLYRNVNAFLRGFPLNLVNKFEKELRGVLSYSHLLQSAIEQHSFAHPLTAECTVYRGFPSNGRAHALVYETVVGDVIVWRGFSSTTTDKARVISEFVGSLTGVLFEILLPPGAVAVSIAEFSDHPCESEILIAASTGFLVESVNWITGPNFGELEIPSVRLSYFASWWDFDLDQQRKRFLLGQRLSPSKSQTSPKQD